REHDVTVTKEDAAECTGGCQCGAVRYQLLRPPEHACICHCRMCQRASGQPFMAFASVRREDLRWTRGRPSTFVSSNIAERNFCSACGTPLTWHRAESGSIAVTIGSLDSPQAVCRWSSLASRASYPGPVGSQRCPPSVPRTGCVITASLTSTIISIQLSSISVTCRSKSFFA